MPCVWLSPSIHTIAEFNPKHITHSGDLLSPFLHPFSTSRIELIQQRLRNIVLKKNGYVYPLYVYISSMNSRRYANKQFLILDQFSMRIGMEKLRIAFCEF